MSDDVSSTAPTKKLSDLVVDKAGMLHPSDSVQMAGDRMRDTHAESLPVTEGRRLVGSVDEPNLDTKVAGFGHDPNHVLVSENMNRNVVFCFEDQDCSQALDIMEQNSLNYLPVVDREMRIIGILRKDDLNQAAKHHQHRDETTAS